MPNTSSLSKFLKADAVKDGDTIKFLDAGEISAKTFKKDGKDETRDILEITVDFHGETKTYSPNGTSINLLSKQWGQATEGWVGKEARLMVVPSSNGKDMIVAKPIVSDEAPLWAQGK